MQNRAAICKRFSQTSHHTLLVGDQNGIPVPTTSDQPPQDIMDVVRCGDKAERNKCGELQLPA